MRGQIRPSLSMGEQLRWQGQLCILLPICYDIGPVPLLGPGGICVL